MSNPMNISSLQFVEEHDLSALCYSSLSDSSFSSMEEEEKLKKVIDRKYSKLAFSVRRVGKEETEESNGASNGIAINDTCSMSDSTKIHESTNMTRITTNKSRAHEHDALGVLDEVICNTIEEPKRKRVVNRKYSRLAFSVFQVVGDKKKRS
jgi:hypothetical protein